MYYSVKLLDPKKQSNSVTADGYIAFNNARYLYQRGEALKKAGYFSGKIELVKEYNDVHKQSMLSIPSSILLYEVRQFLKGRELFESKNGSNRFIYENSVFMGIRHELRDLENNDEDFKIKDEIANQLDELIQLTIESEFVMIDNMCFS